MSNKPNCQSPVSEKPLRWEYGLREGFKTIEIYGFGASESAPPIGVFDLTKSRSIHSKVREYFSNNPHGVIFTLVSESDMGEPFFYNNGDFITPIISVGSCGAKNFREYASILKK